jgi:hypothetical protein
VKSRWLLNLALALLVAGLAALVYFKPGTEPAKAPLTSLKPEAIARLTIEHGAERIELARTNGGWRMVAPVAARASRVAVESALRLATAPSEARLGPATDLTAYGLKAPRARLEFDGAQIALGTLHPLRDQVYALYRGEVYLIGSRYQAPAYYPYGRFLDTRLFEDDFKPAAFRLPGFRLTLKDGSWQREPAIKDLSSDRINDFVQEWRYASALNVERSTRQPALATLEITDARGEQPVKLTLDIVAYQPELVLRRRDEGLEYHFPEETGKRLLNLGKD